MEARVKETGEIVDVEHIVHTFSNGRKVERYETEDAIYVAYELDFDVKEISFPDYWTKLKHQYAGMAMQGLLMNPKLCEIEIANSMASTAYTIVTSLIDKLKEDEQNKETQTDRR